MNSKQVGADRSLLARLVKGPEGFRQLLQRLGPTFIKIGQFLALRPDSLPQDYCDELMHLWDRVPPFAWEEARAIVAEDLGRDPEDVFSFIDPVPVHAGSLAQTHRAELPNGEEVAVKIQRPHLRRRVTRDLRRLRILSRLFDLCGVSLVASAQEVVAELSDWMFREIDFRNELANLTRLYHLTPGSRLVTIPRPYPELSGPRVLTAEYLRGVSVSEVLAALQSGRLRELEQTHDFRIRPSLIASRLLTETFVQIFTFRFFHADVHPGNLIVLPGNVLGYVDFGLCDELDETIRRNLMRYNRAIYNRDLDEMYKASTELLLASDDTDMEAYRRDFLSEASQCFERAGARRERPGAPCPKSGRSPIANCLIGIIGSARRHRLRFPARILSMYRAMVTAEMVSRRLAPEVDLRSVGREYFRNLQKEEFLGSLEWESIQRYLFSCFSALRDSPAQFQQVLSELAEGRFSLNVNVSETARMLRWRNRRTRVIAGAVVSVSLAVLLGWANLPEIFGVSLAWPISGMLIFLYIWLAAQLRDLR